MAMGEMQFCVRSEQQSCFALHTTVRDVRPLQHRVGLPIRLELSVDGPTS
jgi:hypothetical protein